MRPGWMLAVGLVGTLLAADSVIGQEATPSAPPSQVRIGLFSTASAIRVASATPFSLTNPDGNLLPTGPFAQLELVPHPSDHSWDAILPTGHGPESFNLSRGTLQGASSFNVTQELGNITACYRGQLEFRTGADGLTLIDQLDLDDYLKGVVPSEVPAAFPPEALRAMAVVTRTYTLAHLGRHRDQGYDLCSSTHCQVYRGQNQEAPASSAAIEDTRGQTLTAGGKPIDASFSACCGGHSVDMTDCWPGRPALAYLSGDWDQPAELARPDLAEENQLRAWLVAAPAGYCQAAKRSRWDLSLSWSDFEARLRVSLPVLLGRGYHAFNHLLDLRVTRRDPSGRVAELVLSTDQGNYVVGHDAVRWLTSGGHPAAGALNSSLFWVETPSADAVNATDAAPTPLPVLAGEQPVRLVVLHGAGWGHGVGLCQEGAAGRALAGQNYRQIMAHYYPGSMLAGAPLEPTPLFRPVSTTATP